MSTSALLDQIKEDMKAAMRSKEKERLGVIRMFLAAVKQKEVDERVELKDEDVIVLLDKLIKQRRESIKQYEQAQRSDLAQQEQSELDVLKVYLPEPLSEEALNQAIEKVLQEVAPQGMQDMGKVMAILKPQLQGKADLGQVSQMVKARLA